MSTDNDIEVDKSLGGSIYLFIFSKSDERPLEAMDSSINKVHSHISLVALPNAYFWALFALKFSSNCTIFPVSSPTKRSHYHNTELPQFFLNLIYYPSEPMMPDTNSPRNSNPCTPLKSRGKNGRMAEGQSSRCLI